jgi:hypothetical protein
MAKKSLEIFLFIFHFLKKKTRRVAKIRQPKKKTLFRTHWEQEANIGGNPAPPVTRESPKVNCG